jgi:hypothetical protein
VDDAISPVVTTAGARTLMPAPSSLVHFNCPHRRAAPFTLLCVGLVFRSPPLGVADELNQGYSLPGMFYLPLAIADGTDSVKRQFLRDGFIISYAGGDVEGGQSCPRP